MSAAVLAVATATSSASVSVFMWVCKAGDGVQAGGLCETYTLLALGIYLATAVP